MDSFVIGKTQERINQEILTTDRILSWSDEKREKLKKEIESVYIHAFPNMGDEDSNSYIGDYFAKAIPYFRRQVILFRNESNKLIASSVCNYGKLDCNGIVMKGIYIISRAILPEYQKFGLGKMIAMNILNDLKPDILFTTCAQSSSLHSWVGLVRNGLVTGYDVYPRLDEKEILITMPFENFDFIITAFEQTYLGVIEGKQEDLDKAIRNLTVFMVRKNIYRGMYDYRSWEKDGREDKLAKALGVTDKDGILVIFVKEGLL